jgi:hypothetical protein
MSVFLEDGPDGSFYLVTVDWSDAAFQRISAQFSAITGCHVRVLARDDPSSAGYNGFRVKTAGGFHADVYGMIVNWCLALVPEGETTPVPERYWCFAGRDMLSLALAIGQAALWDGADGWAPTGFVRAWDRED